MSKSLTEDTAHDFMEALQATVEELVQARYHLEHVVGCDGRDKYTGGKCSYCWDADKFINNP